VDVEDEMNVRRIVVGVDGSAHSERAVRWAAGEAHRRGAAVEVVYGYEWAWPGAKFAGAVGIEAEARQHADEFVMAAMAVAKAAAPDVDVVASAVRGRPTSVLLDAADQAELVVVGSRGRGGFVNLLMGSVSLQVATHAPGPVVVVPEADATSDGPVVVGVAGPASSGPALESAFQAAAARGCRLVAVQVYTPPSPPWGTGVEPLVGDPAHEIEMRRVELDETLAPWREKYPRVAVEARVVTGRPVEVLVGVSSAAQLVVVGTRGRGGFTGLLLGSVGQQVMHHAKCPVLIARTGPHA
jgi:nucleotide-binding universal stress UspA family protein